jgi:circadian clock protein KaiC
MPADHDAGFDTEPIPSGVDGLDSLLNGGIERGTVTVISGPTGVGKTTTGTQFLHEAATRGERSVVYLFEETDDTYRYRSESIGVPISEMEAEGTLSVREVEPLTRSAEAFAQQVREEVEQRDARVVMLDGINGYKLALRGDDDALVRKLHALCRYLKNMGVTVILVDEVDTVTGEFQATDAGISYLADNVLFLRHLELDGELRKAVGVLKKRVGPFERTLREFEITPDGVRVGQSLNGVRGILQGTPEQTDGDGVAGSSGDPDE